MEQKYSAKAFWRAVARACAFFGVYLGSQLIVTSAITTVYSFLYALRHGTINEDAVTEMVYASVMELTVIANVIAIILCIILAKAFRKKPTLEAIDMNLSFDKKPALLGACVFLGIFGQIAILFILNIIPFPESWTQLLEESNSQITDSNPAIQVLSVAIMAPLAEEIIFRASIQGSLKEGMPRWIAIIVASLVFGVMHANPIGIIYATALGIMMGWLYSKFNSIIPSMVFHLAFNTTSLILSLLNGVDLITCIICCALFTLCIVFIAGIKNSDKNGENNDENL